MALDNRTVSGADKLKQRIATIRSRYSLPTLTEEVGQLLLRRTKDRFDKEVGPGGEKWKELSPSTLADKFKEGAGSKGKLVRTGKLRDSIQLIRGTAAGSVFTNTGAGVRIGVAGPPDITRRARVHNKGFKAKSIPARQFLGIDDLDIKAVDSLLRRKAKQLENF